jgi:hypothetical protein
MVHILILEKKMTSEQLDFIESKLLSIIEITEKQQKEVKEISMLVSDVLTTNRKVIELDYDLGIKIQKQM